MKDGAWAATLNQVEILADYNPATGIITQRPGTDVPSANELSAVFSCNGAVKMSMFVNDNPVGSTYLYPFGNEVDGLLFGTVVRNKSADYNESINVLFSVNDDDEVAFSVYRSVTPKGRCIVTLTPTAQDFSGTMDKTVAEINAAYEAGQKIVFRTILDETRYMDVDCTARYFAGTTYPSFNGFILNSDSDVFLFAFTGATNDGTDQSYGTVVYPLTPATW